MFIVLSKHKPGSTRPGRTYNNSNGSPLPLYWKLDKGNPYVIVGINISALGFKCLRVDKFYEKKQRKLLMKIIWWCNLKWRIVHSAGNEKWFGF